MKKTMILILTFFLLSACEAEEEHKEILVESTKKEENQMDKERKKIDKNSKEYRAYKEHKHRFTLNGCEMTYNEQPFYFGMSIEEVRKLFGKETLTYKGKGYRKNSKRYYWEDKGLELGIKNSKVWRMEIYLKKLSEQRYTKAKVIGNKYIIFNEAPLSQTDKMKEYIKRSNLAFNDFFVNESGYRISYNCEDDKIRYSLFSEVFKHMVGGGHLYTFDSWDFNNTNEVKMVYIYSEKLEEEAKR